MALTAEERQELAEQRAERKAAQAAKAAAKPAPGDWWDDWGQQAAGYGIAAAGIIGGAALTIATLGAGWQTGLMLAGGGLTIGGKLIDGDIQADKAKTIAGEQNAIAEKKIAFQTAAAGLQRDQAFTELDSQWKIDGSDGTNSKAERQLAELTASLTDQRDTALDQANVAANSASFELGQGLVQANAAEAQALTTAARSGVRMGSGSIAAGLVQTIEGVKGQMAEAQRRQGESMTMAGSQITRGWEAGQRGIADFTADANSAYTLGKSGIELNYNLNAGGIDVNGEKVSELSLAKEGQTLLTKDYNQKIDDIRVGSYLQAAGALFDLGTNMLGMGMFDFSGSKSTQASYSFPDTFTESFDSYSSMPEFKAFKANRADTRYYSSGLRP